MKPLENLLARVEITRRSPLNANEDVRISQIEYDSRRVQPGTLFVAMKGGATDGNLYIEQAIARGAVAIATDTASFFDSLHATRAALPVLEVPQGRRALAELSRAFYDYPDTKLGLTGVTGTNGKTTTAYLLEQILAYQKRKTILIGTIEYRIGDRVLPSPHTTPESRDLLAIFAEGLAEGATEAVMEVSSHALDQGRVWQLAFDVAIFTNLTRDHLDYHGTLEDYLRAKQRLFDGTSSQAPRQAIINSDDHAGAQLAAAAKQAGAEVLTYGISSGDYRATGINMSASGTRFVMQTPSGGVPLESKLLGRINVYNLLAASVAAHARRVTFSDIGSAVETLQAPPGRFESIDAGQKFTVIVDYAHTDDALRNVTRLAREITQTNHGRVITVFGCGGDRDKTKRPLMGKAAGEGSDVVVVTSDNPRSEQPEAIIEQVLPGLKGTAAQVLVEPDRARAIHLSLEQARAGDLVLIAGKGHEKTQTIGTQVLPFDDAAIARHTLAEMVNRGSR
jgi:UDP-N-acetylmuramoyl-L-alanyl-D-glutamate--2,6-diaminopimelate ligase